MGAGGVPNRSLKISYERSLKPKGHPNSRYDRYKDGELVQSRWYDENGKAIRNRDYKHQNPHNNHFFPHDHNWKWNGDDGDREKDILPPDYENFN